MQGNGGRGITLPSPSGDSREARLERAQPAAERCFWVKDMAFGKGGRSVGGTRVVVVS